MSRKFFRKYLPDAEQVRAHRLTRVFGAWLHHPNLWHLNRHSVAAVAIGLFAGLVPGPLQMLTALALAVPFRANLPVALLATFYTNPFTIVPLYFVALAYGRLILPGTHNKVPIEPFETDWTHFLDSMHALVVWMLSLGKPLAVGLVALALTLAVLGYLGVQLAWRAYVILAWRARATNRKVYPPLAARHRTTCPFSGSPAPV